MSGADFEKICRAFDNIQKDRPPENTRPNQTGKCGLENWRGFLMQRPVKSGENGQGQHGDALFQQLAGFLRRALPAYVALGRFAVVHAARFFGKARAHVFGVGHHLANKLQIGRLQGGKRVGDLLIALPCRGCACLAAGGQRAQIEPGGAGAALNFARAAQRTGQQAALALLKKIFLAGEPPFKHMAAGAVQIKDFHRRAARPAAMRR